MKKVLVISEELLSPDLYLRIKNEGCDVAIAQKFKDTKDILKGTLKRIPWDSKMDYAKTCDLVICDDNTNDIASQLRQQGVSAIGGDKKTVRLELDRKFASDTAKACGLLIPEVIKVKDLEDAKRIIKERGGKWVLKQEKKLDNVKGLNGIAKLDNSEDVLSYIDFLQSRWIPEIPQDFVLQEKIEGAEMAIGSWFDGESFVKDKDGDILVEENFEHKPLTPTGGESTGEMYTVMRYVKAKHSKLYSETLEKVIPMLKQIDFRGDFDINCIVTAKGAYFLEYTPRMGVPATSGQIAIHKTPWFDFLKGIADKKQVPFEYDPRWTIVCWLYCKPFPFGGYSKKLEDIYQEKLVNFNKLEEIQELLSFKLSNSKDAEVMFKEKLNKEELNNLHWDGVYFDGKKLLVANSAGYVLTATGQGENVEDAGKYVDDLLKKIIVPKAFWRNDFNDTNYHKSKDDLTKWGYLDAEKKKQEAEAKAEKDRVKKEKKEMRDLLKKAAKI